MKFNKDKQNEDVLGAQEDASEPEVTDLSSEEELLAKVKEAAFEGAKEGASHARVKVKQSFLGALFSKVLTPFVIVLAVSTALSSFNPLNILCQLTTGKKLEEYSAVLSNRGIFGFEAMDFGEPILGDASRQVKMEVYSQEISGVNTKTNAGFMNFSIFNKSKVYTYYATVTYSLDLSLLTQESIVYDKENNEVTIYIPHVDEPDLNLHEEKTEFDDSERGMLAFGEINLTDDEKIQFTNETMEKMREKLLEDNIAEKADEFARKSVWDTYQPMVTMVSSGTTLKVKTGEPPVNGEGDASGDAES